jgi:hypothetical protein
LVTELFEEIEFGLAEGRAFVGASGEVLVEAFHESDRVNIVSGPETGYNGFGAGEEEGALKAGDSLFAEEFARAGLTGGKDDEVRTKRQVADLADL